MPGTMSLIDRTARVMSDLVNLDRASIKSLSSKTQAYDESGLDLDDNWTSFYSRALVPICEQCLRRTPVPEAY
jgi:hypothetical protein